MKSNRNNKVKKVRGFTLIELLVVIAIIGILSSVVLASVNIARAKGADTAAKSNITNIRAQAELVYDNNSGFYNNILTGNTVCNDSNVVAGLSGAAEKEGFTWTSISDNSADVGCYDAPTYWVAYIHLVKSAGTWWCIDNNGIAKSETVTPFGTPEIATGMCP